ncbi:cell wall biogenesis protein [Diaporthe eres]|uniref:Thiamine-binding protein domain-containing protein n=1 Tax=Diaporthe vaccinii TaxID=105482 RepID=A0ABR4EZ69_9PEZI|nr:cell wall biogenesis protein [Diaporthe eres]
MNRLLTRPSPRFRSLNRAPLSHSATSRMDYSSVPTPERCYADFCLVPVGTGELSVAKEVAEVQKLLKASGLTYTMHSAGTTVEGSWDEVMRVIGQAHSVVHQVGPQRIQTSMRVGTRTDKKQTAADKVRRVEDLLAEKK